jgi:hypothetical protein
MSSGEEGVLYFLAPKCLRRGYKLLEREPSPGLKGKVRLQRRLLEMLVFFGGMETGFFVVCCSLFICPPCRAPVCPFIG